MWRHEMEMEQERFQDEDATQIDLMELLSFLWSRIGWIILAIALCAAIAFTYTRMFIDPTYTSTGKLYIVSNSDSNMNQGDFQVSNYLAKDYEEVVYTHEVLSRTIANLGLPYSLGEFRNMISVRNPTNTRIIEITARTESAAEAPAIVNELMNMVTNYISDVMATAKPNPLSQPLMPTSPSGPSTSRNTLLGGALGGFLSVLALGAIFVLDDKLKTPDDIQKHAGLATLAIIPSHDPVKAPTPKRKAPKRQVKQVER